MALRIVLVDDDESIAELLRANFELDERFELVGSARNGLEGIELVQAENPDAVLMDLHMPVLGGVDATRRILEANPTACVIAFTASDDPAEHAAAGRRCGGAAEAVGPRRLPRRLRGTRPAVRPQPRRRRLAMRARVVLAAVLSAALVVPAAGVSASSRDLSAYAGLGTWLDIFAGKSAWGRPGREVAAMRRDGARTLYIETGNYKQTVDLMRQRALGRFIDDAHAAGMRVVAWYLPSFANLARDERRALAAIRFRSPGGGRFDGFALDIEATVVRGLPLRNRRLIRLSARLRSAVGPDYALGAITPSPVGMSRYYWPDIPYRTLARYYDVFLPMAYSTMKGIRGSAATLSYLSATVRAVRTSAGNPRVPIHLIGGLGHQMGSSETTGFMRAIKTSRPLGYSLYALPATRRGAWSALRSGR